MVRELIFYEHHFFEFYEQQTLKVQEIDFVLDLIVNVERVPEKFLKHLEGSDDLYEIRVKFASNIFRIFCFFDKGKIIVVLQAIQKKSEKIPKKSIEQAGKLKHKYFNEKKQ